MASETCINQLNIFLNIVLTFSIQLLKIHFESHRAETSNCSSVHSDLHIYFCWSHSTMSLDFMVKRKRYLVNVVRLFWSESLMTD